MGYEVEYLKNTWKTKKESHKIFSEMEADVDSVQNFEDQRKTEILLKVYSYLRAYLNISSAVLFHYIPY